MVPPRSLSSRRELPFVTLKEAISSPPSPWGHDGDILGDPVSILSPFKLPTTQRENNLLTVFGSGVKNRTAGRSIAAEIKHLKPVPSGPSPIPHHAI